MEPISITPYEVDLDEVVIEDALPKSPINNKSIK